MKNKKLMESLSLIDDELILDADPEEAFLAIKARNRKSNFKKFAISAIAATFVLAIAIPALVLGSMGGVGCTTASPTTGAMPVTTVAMGNAPGMNDAPEMNEDASNGDWGNILPMEPGGTGDVGNEQTGGSYTEIVENGFVNVAETSKSYFSIDVSTASFPNIRSTLKAGYLPSKDAYRVEEILNYFKFDYERPTGEDTFKLNASVFPNPYNSETKLLTLGLAAEAVEFQDVQNNLVFLIDVRGSMYSDNKLPLAQKAFKLLAENLNPTDRVSIVTYAGEDRVALSGAYGYEKEKITAVIDDLSAGGSTAGASGIQTAYQLAAEYFIEGGNNRVILMTDGDFNVGISSIDGLKAMIGEKRSSGVYFSVYGFGNDNWMSDKMEALALAGNGMYGFIDSELEAKRALVDEIGGSLVVVAKDVKAGIVFNEAYIDAYRLVGYETKQMTQDEFENTETDAGEIGSGHTVTVVYEIKLKEGVVLTEEGALASVELKYKTPDTNEDKSLTLDVSTAAYHETMTADDAFVASVVEFVLIARDSAYKADATLATLIARLDALDLSEDAYKAEFREIVKLYRTLLNK